MQGCGPLIASQPPQPTQVDCLHKQMRPNSIALVLCYTLPLHAYETDCLCSKTCKPGELQACRHQSHYQPTQLWGVCVMYGFPVVIVSADQTNVLERACLMSHTSLLCNATRYHSSNNSIAQIQQTGAGCKPWQNSWQHSQPYFHSTASDMRPLHVEGAV